MVVDSSALVAIVLREPERDRFVELLTDAGGAVMSAVSAVETAMVVESRRGQAAVSELDELLRALDVSVVPVDAAQAMIARRAWRRFGKGNHPAALNLGDVFVYALAASMGQPLLCKGTDFTQTDVVLAAA